MNKGRTDAIRSESERGEKQCGRDVNRRQSWLKALDQENWESRGLKGEDDDRWGGFKRRKSGRVRPAVGRCKV